MDNQHQKISGYRDLTQAEIDLMNEIKAIGPQLQALCAKVEDHITKQQAAILPANTVERQAEQDRINEALPYLWLTWGRDGMRLALMQLTRAVAQPTTF